MNLGKKTLEKLRILINEETEYRSGPQLVAFFNQLGFNDSYGQGFPSRWSYTDDRLDKINGRPELDSCIKQIFAPINFIGRSDELKKFINEFNQYLSFDGWEIFIVDNKEISFRRVHEIKIDETESVNESSFLEKDYDSISLDGLDLDPEMKIIISMRLDEIKNCLISKSPMAVIFLCGSTLEGILLNLAGNYPSDFNQSKSAPKDKMGKVKRLHDWTLSELIDVSKERNFIESDVKKFSSSLRDFRNYIHPYQQRLENFRPSDKTAEICWKVLEVAVYQISTKIRS